jgi:hypothetical protein
VTLSCYREPVYVSWSNSVDQALSEAFSIGEILWQLVLSYLAVGISVWGTSVRLILQLSFTQSWIYALRSCVQVLGAFAKLRKAALIFVVSCLIAWNISAHSRRISMTFGIWEFLQKIQVSLKPDKNNGLFTWRPICTFMILSSEIIPRVKNVSDKTCRGNQNTYFIFIIVVPCILITPELFCQLMHYLLNIENVKIYIKMLYSRSYMFRSPMTIIRELFTEPG